MKFLMNICLFFKFRTLLKLANLISTGQEYILQFMGFSANLVASELEKLQKYEELQVIN
jgi:hypothetical protein